MRHCCESMRYHVEFSCDVHRGRHACPDCLIDYRPESRSYGLFVHDGGTSTIAIRFCPWCGTRLAADDETLPVG